jgi:hypothetical protein
LSNRDLSNPRLPIGHAPKFAAGVKMSESRVPNYEDALRMLAENAQEGSVTAIVALERVLRSRERGEQELDAAIAEITAKADR